VENIDHLDIEVYFWLYLIIGEVRSLDAHLLFYSVIYFLKQDMWVI
jgi:hypothetical protein